MSNAVGVAETLAHGELAVEGRLPWSSNFTFLVAVKHDNESVRAIYKPEQGEQPLADFAPGLYRREVAAYELSATLGWPLVPPTIARDDGPYGTGSLQLFVDADFEQHYFTLLNRAELRAQLMDIAIFDVIANNADRKAGHCLLVGNAVYAIDNGLCFHTDPKLRTVVWEFGGERISQARIDDLKGISTGHLSPLLEPGEIDALSVRIQAVVDHPVLPLVTDGRQYPWPLI